MLKLYLIGLVVSTLCAIILGMSGEYFTFKNKILKEMQDNYSDLFDSSAGGVFLISFWAVMTVFWPVHILVYVVLSLISLLKLLLKALSEKLPQNWIDKAEK